MEKAVVFIEDRVQDVGYRVFVMERLLESNLDGGAINTLDGRVKVLVEGEKEEILAFFNRLKKEKPELSEKVVMTEPEFDSSLRVPDKMALCHSLQMNQFGKAVNYLARLDDKMDQNLCETRKLGVVMNENLCETRKLRKEVGCNMNETRKMRKETNWNFGRLDKKYGSVSRYLKRIDKNIDTGLKELNKNVVTLVRAVLIKNNA